MYRPSAARWSLTLLLLGAVLTGPRVNASPDKLQDLRQQADAFEKQGDWEKACDLYEAALRLRRDVPDIKQRYIHCVRRLWQVRRHHDDSYRREILSIEYGQAVHLYIILRDLLLDQSLERKKLNPRHLFRRGLDELDWALADPYFCEQHVPSNRLHKVAEFRAMLLKTWRETNPASRKQALKQVCEIALAAQGYLGIRPTVSIMEFTCGACYALDEYTVYLTPTQLRELCSSLRGELVGIGVTLLVDDTKVIIQHVPMMSPATDKLVEGEQILSIDKRAVASLPIETVQGMLEGPPGSVVEVEVLSPALGATRTVALRRELVMMPSVSYFMLPDSSTGYLRIAAFQETTVKEVDEALARLTESGMKALVLDLRANSGGLFDAAVDVARRFLSSGLIATKQHLDEKSRIITTFCEAKNASALTLPLVLVVDNDTASAAEVLAGALKENGRATIVGQTTHGKGCTQFLIKLPELKGGLPAGGMRLTVAKVFSPKGLPYTGRGVTPDLFVERGATPTQSMMTPIGFDPQRDAAQFEAQRLQALTAR